MKHNNKILIVDDNNENLSVLGNILINHGYSVQVANNGKLAIEMAHRKHPDLILLDVKMPEMTGFEACQILKKNPDTSEIPIIFLTAHTSTESIVEGFSLGAVDYVTKPFQKEELLSRVKTHIRLKNTTEALLQKNNELEALNATKDKLFSIIGHDLRGPMGTILGIVEVILDNEVNETELHDFLVSQKQVARSTYYLLENLLQWAKQNMNQVNFKPRSVDFVMLFDEILEAIEVSASQKKININTSYQSTQKVLADENMLKLIIRNLLMNAIKFTPTEGSISIIATNNDKHVEISIQDTGVGIATENIRKILDDTMFYSTNGTNNEQGSGLGLKLVKNFLITNNSKLEIKSVPGEGSCFTFSLPMGN